VVSPSPPTDNENCFHWRASDGVEKATASTCGSSQVKLESEMLGAQTEQPQKRKHRKKPKSKPESPEEVKACVCVARYRRKKELDPDPAQHNHDPSPEVSETLAETSEAKVQDRGPPKQSDVQSEISHLAAADAHHSVDLKPEISQSASTDANPDISQSASPDAQPEISQSASADAQPEILQSVSADAQPEILQSASSADAQQSVSPLASAEAQPTNSKETPAPNSETSAQAVDAQQPAAEQETQPEAPGWKQRLCKDGVVRWFMEYRDDHGFRSKREWERQVLKKNRSRRGK
ncbi:unnamed protein product, partial [Durusdinium trenchii]